MDIIESSENPTPTLKVTEPKQKVSYMIRSKSKFNKPIAPRESTFGKSFKLNNNKNFKRKSGILSFNKNARKNRNNIYYNNASGSSTISRNTHNAVEDLL